MSEKNTLIVINPLSGRKGQAWLKRLVKELDNMNTRYEIYTTGIDDELNRNVIAEKLDGCESVIVLGGDGTLHMLANLLAYKNIPLGIIPCGTGNDFARNVYGDNHDVIAIVTGQHVEAVDLGRCNDHYFINVLGVGYDGMITEQTGYNKKTMFRSLFYLWNALKYLARYKEQVMTIESDEHSCKKLNFITTFANGAFFGNGMKIAPRADLQDGMLEYCHIGKLRFLKKCHLLVKIFSGKHITENCVDYSQGQQFRITTPGLPVEADGEFLGYTPVEISIEKQALLLKLPAPVITLK